MTEHTLHSQEVTHANAPMSPEGRIDTWRMRTRSAIENVGEVFDFGAEMTGSILRRGIGVVASGMRGLFGARQKNKKHS